LTFASAQYLREVAREIPLQHIFIETDSPYLTPVPYRGKEENEPMFTKYVLQKIQELRKENPEEIEKQIFENSIDFFGIKKKGA
jgi:TatD DNase family protein